MKTWTRGTRVMLAIVAVLAGVGVGSADSDTQTYFGKVGFIDDSSVEVGGARGLFSAGSSVMSDGHAVSPSSVRTGMPATLEIDATGRIVELRVTGVVE